MGLSKYWFAAIGAPGLDEKTLKRDRGVTSIPPFFPVSGKPCDGNSPESYSGPISLNFELPPNPLEKSTEFQGAGSLIKPEMSCFGCDKDDAVMYPSAIPAHSSTVVFQTKNTGNCQKYVDISSVDNTKIGQVLVSVRKWNDPQIIHTYLAAKLPVSVPVVGNYSVIAVTTLDHLNANPNSSLEADVVETKDSTVIRAACSANDQNNAGRIEIPESLDVLFSNNYTWAGNGSIISGETKSCAEDGCTQDFAIALDKLALTAFQWQVSKRCKTLRIQEVDRNYDVVNGNGDFSGRLKYKKWYSPTWTYYGNNDGYFSSAPDITSNDGTYYIVAIETLGGVIPSDHRIKASCATSQSSTSSSPSTTSGSYGTLGTGSYYNQ